MNWLYKLAKQEPAALFDSKTVSLIVYQGGEKKPFTMQVEFKTINPEDSVEDLKSMARQLGKFIADYGTIVSNKFKGAKMVGDVFASVGLVSKLEDDRLVFENGLDDVMRGQ